MKKVIASVFALALALALGNATAAEVKGKIAKIAPDYSWFTLTDGTEFTLGTDVSMKGMKPGTKVKIIFEQQDGKNVATKVHKGIHIAMEADYSDL